MRCFLLAKLKQCIFTFYSVLCEHIKDFAPLIRHLTAIPSSAGKAKKNRFTKKSEAVFCYVRY